MGLELRRSPHGERGLKFGDADKAKEVLKRRSPHGERGLKLHDKRAYTQIVRVAPPTGSVD